MDNVLAVFGFIKNRFKRLDKLLVLLCLIASGFGVCMLYTMYKNGITPDVVSARSWKVQAASALAGVCVALFISLIDYRLISKLWFIYVPFVIGLSLLLFTPLGMSTAGSTEVNWLDLGFIQVQPSEFLTVTFIMTFSTHLSKVGDKMNKLIHVALLCLHAAVPAVLMILQDNTGSPVLLLLIFALMIFLSGISVKYIAAAGVALPLIAYLFWNFYAKDYHKLRILVIFDKEIQESEKLDYFHQQYKSLTALSSGGITGQGLSGGDYISFFAIRNDFIFSYIGMTLGLIGCILVILLLLCICVKILVTMTAVKDPLGKAICAGAFASIFFQSVINIGMATAATPVVGLPLPFISAGGSSTLSLYVAIGLVLSVWSHREGEYHLFYKEK